MATVGISEEDQREIRRAIKKLDGIKGPGVRHQKDSLYIDAPSQQEVRSQATIPDLWVYIDSAEAGAGKYKGYEFVWSSDEISAATMVRNDDLGSVQTEELLVINMFEEGRAEGHIITDGDVTTKRFYPARWHPGGALSTTGLRVAVIDGFDYFTCSTAADAGEFSSF